MENAKKMILIEPGLIEKLKQENKVTSNLSRLDIEMQNIMNSKMEDRKKWMLYLQTLQRYLHFTEEDRQPLSLPIYSDTPNEDSNGSKIGFKNKDRDLKSSVDAESLLEEKGSIKSIERSNIVDLINDSLRPLKKSDPVGWDRFAKALKDIKVPLTYIGNPKRCEFINQLQAKRSKQDL
ncbi:hypothetical protein HF086_001860 [Spodoptera exigua]|uniref:Uncharacterized protein n=1 Tax=Spodoptera exigua TaxID=7107 RepID=A0A922MA27_SPOEX|nr:hypothetical protein HF086_001860 [Spodoptera exigua]